MTQPQAYESQSEFDRLRTELKQVKAELAVARERLGPAGYKILEEVKDLREAFTVLWKMAETVSSREKIDCGQVSEAYQTGLNHGWGLASQFARNAITSDIVEKCKSNE